MERIALGASGRHTTRLGFGCSNLMGAMGRGDSLRLLEAAYGAGIRHFDVAPMYGYGEAESCLSQFLKHHRDQVTITTKYGIPPAKNSVLIRAGRRLAAPVIKQIPSLKKRIAKTVNAVVRNDERPTFTAVQAKASLDRSLANLGTDRIDLWLLHEVTAHNLQDDNLLRLLEDLVQQGTIGTFGIGSNADKIPALLAERAAYCRTLQYEWSIFASPIPDSPILTSKPFRIHHRALTDNFRGLHAALVKDKLRCQRWSSSTNADLSDEETLAKLMLKAALAMNPSSIVLFSSKNPRHIQANVNTASDVTLDQPARQLYTLVQSERDQLVNIT